MHIEWLVHIKLVSWKTLLNWEFVFIQTERKEKKRKDDLRKIGEDENSGKSKAEKSLIEPA